MFRQVCTIEPSLFNRRPIEGRHLHHFHFKFIKVETKFKNCNFKFKKLKSKFKNRNFKFNKVKTNFKNRNFKLKKLKTKFKNRNFKFKKVKSKFKNRNFKFKKLKTKFKNRNFKFKKVKSKFKNRPFFNHRPIEGRHLVVCCNSGKNQRGIRRFNAICSVTILILAILSYVYKKIAHLMPFFFYKRVTFVASKLSARGQFIFCLWSMCTTFSHNFKNINQNGQNQSCDTIALKRLIVLIYRKRRRKKMRLTKSTTIHQTLALSAANPATENATSAFTATIGRTSRADSSVTTTASTPPWNKGLTSAPTVITLPPRNLRWRATFSRNTLAKALSSAASAIILAPRNATSTPTRNDATRPCGRTSARSATSAPCTKAASRNTSG